MQVYDVRVTERSTEEVKSFIHGHLQANMPEGARQAFGLYFSRISLR
jgi:hypothetical protein